MTATGDDHVLRVLDALFQDARRRIVDDEVDGLRPSQFRVIDSVPSDGITVTALAAEVGMTAQGIGQFVRQLAADGFLHVDRDPDDRRTRIVRRTSLGEAAAERLAAQLHELEREWATLVGARRYREFRAVLDQIAAST